MVFYLCDRQCCRATSLHNLKKTGNQISEIVKIIHDNGLQIIFGGEGLKHLKKTPKDSVKIFKSYNELTRLV